MAAQPSWGNVLRFPNAMAVETVSTHNKPPLNRAFHLMQQALDGGRGALEGLRSSGGTRKTLEEELSSLRDELSPTDTLFRVFVTGKSRAFRPVMQEQLYLIGREALINAVRHSKARNIEAEIEYLPRRLSMVVRDNGCGMDPQVMRRGRNAHWGRTGMRERAGSIGAKLRIWSRAGFGTEIELSVPADVQPLQAVCLNTHWSFKEQRRTLKP
jgi:signal transduction histidine kinase